MNKIEVSAGENRDQGEILKSLVGKGAHLGYSRARTHPSARRFVFGFKNQGAIIDLDKTLTALDRAKTFLRGLGEAGKIVLWVGTKPEAKAVIEDVARRLDHPFVASRWLGGTLTNLSQQRARIERLNELKEKKAQGALAAYTKRERQGFDEEIEKLEAKFGTIVNLKEPPAALVVIDAVEEAIAVTEAGIKEVPVVGLSGSDCDLGPIDYPIVANDSSRASIEFFIQELAAAYEVGRSQLKLEV